MNSIRKYFKKELLDNKHPSFHFINTLGWVLLFAADSFIVSPAQVLANPTTFIQNLLEWLTFYLITVGMRIIYKSYPFRSKTIFNIIGLILVIAFISSILFYFCGHFIFLLFNFTDQTKIIHKIFSAKYIISRMTQLFPLLTTWSLLYFGIKFWIELSEERQKAEKADLLAQSAQLLMLRYQINPHFLFNSFSSLRALIRIDQKKAEKMVGKLSEFYRYTLVTKSNTEVSLIEEIEAIIHYTEIEKIRFENNIEFDYSIDPLAEEYPIPSFLIHPLVENAIKYGMKTSKMPLQIQIKANVENDWLIIQIINSGKLFINGNDQNYSGTGTGLSNVKSRLEYSYQNNNSFELIEQEGNVCATVKIFKELK